jgi:hypothetical protein
MKTTKLAVLTAVVLLVLSFAFSSCKNCNGSKGKDGGKNNQAPTTDPKKEGLTVSQIQAFVDEAAGYAYEAYEAGTAIGREGIAKYQDTVTARQNLEDLTIRPDSASLVQIDKSGNL